MQNEVLPLIANAFLETLYMILVAMLVSSVFGGILGILLRTTGKNQILECVPLNKVLAIIVNTIRSIPFVILMVAIIPFTRMVAGSSIGTTAAIVPLVIAYIPFVARLIETSLAEVPEGVVEAAEAMGTPPLKIVWNVLLPEARGSIAAQLTTVVISLVGDSAMAGTIGGGGLGDLAIRYGYQRFRPEVMAATVLVLVIFVQVVQFAGNRWVTKLVTRFDKA